MIVPILVSVALAGQPAPPPPPFTARCAACHGDDARGTAQAPGLVMNPRVAVLSVDQLKAYVERGNPGAGMPPFAGIPDEELLALAHYLRRINQETVIPPPPAPRGAIAWRPAATRRLAHLQRQRFRQPLQSADADHARERRLAEVEMGLPDAVLRPRSHAARSRRRALRHRPEPGVRARRRSPAGRSGHYSRPPTPGLVGDSQLGTNRGVAHPARPGLLRHRQRAPAGARSRHRQAALGNADGARPPSASRHHYGGTIAPLVVDDMVSQASPARDHGIRGFVAAFKAETGALVWRHWTVPAPGRARHRDVAGHGADQRRRFDLAHRLLRSVVRHALLGHRQSLARWRRPRSPGRQPLHQLRARARCRRPAS